MGKQHLNVGTIGHVDHGKTTLTAAITQVMGRLYGGATLDVDDLDRAPAEKASGITITIKHVKYESAHRSYAHIDCPGHADYVKNMITGASQMDGAVLLVDGSVGPQLQTREHVLLARQVGVGHLVVFINKVDIADPELLSLVELETLELLEANGFKGSPVIKGSALKAMQAAMRADATGEETACIRALVDALDRHIPVPHRDQLGPFLMPVEDVFSISGRGTVVTGRVQRGTLRAGAELEVLGDTQLRVVVVGIEAFHQTLEEAHAGDNVGLLLRGIKREQINRGAVLSAPGAVLAHLNGQAELFILSAKEGGRHTPFASGYMPQFFFGATDVTGTVEVLGEPGQLVLPGDHARVAFRLLRPIGLEPGMRFALREGGKTVGAGVVTAVA